MHITCWELRHCCSQLFVHLNSLPKLHGIKKITPVWLWHCAVVSWVVLGNSLGTCRRLLVILRGVQLSSWSQRARPRGKGQRQCHPNPHIVSQHRTPCHSLFSPCPTLLVPAPSSPSLPGSLHHVCSCCPSCRSFQLLHSVISHWRSQLQLGWSGQTSLSLYQQGMLEITRHTTLIDAATAYTPHFRQSEMAGINSLLLDSMWGVGGGEPGVGETRKYLFMIFSFKSIYLIFAGCDVMGAGKTRDVWRWGSCSYHPVVSPLGGSSQLGTNPPTTFFL